MGLEESWRERGRVADVAKRRGEGGVLGFGARARPGPSLGIDGGDENVPARVANEVEARKGDEERDVIVGDGRRCTAVDTHGGGAGTAVSGADDEGGWQRGGGVEGSEWREAAAFREKGGNVEGVVRSGVGKSLHLQRALEDADVYRDVHRRQLHRSCTLPSFTHGGSSRRRVATSHILHANSRPCLPQPSRSQNPFSHLLQTSPRGASLHLAVSLAASLTVLAVLAASAACCSYHRQASATEAPATAAAAIAAHRLPAPLAARAQPRPSLPPRPDIVDTR
jgi:hypothetical protein